VYHQKHGFDEGFGARFDEGALKKAK